MTIAEIIGCVAIVGAIFSLGCYEGADRVQVRWDVEKLANKQAVADAIAAGDAKAAKFENDLNAEKKRNTDLQTKMGAYLAKHPELSAVKLPAGSLQLLDDAIAGKTSSGFDTDLRPSTETRR